MQLKRKPKFIYFDVGHVLLESYNEDILYVKEGVIEALDMLYGNFRMGILSNTGSSAKGLKKELLKYHIGSYFDVFVTSGDVGYAKPYIRIYENAIEKANEKSADILFIDDLLDNLEGAQLAGMDNLVLQKYKYETDNYPMIDSLKELITLLDEVER